ASVFRYLPDPLVSVRREPWRKQGGHWMRVLLPNPAYPFLDARSRQITVAGRWRVSPAAAQPKAGRSIHRSPAQSACACVRLVLVVRLLSVRPRSPANLGGQKSLFAVCRSSNSSLREDDPPLDADRLDSCLDWRHAPCLGEPALNDQGPAGCW